MLLHRRTEIHAGLNLLAEVLHDFFDVRLLALGGDALERLAQRHAGFDHDRKLSGNVDEVLARHSRPARPRSPRFGRRTGRAEGGRIFSLGADQLAGLGKRFRHQRAAQGGAGLIASGIGEGGHEIQISNLKFAMR